MKKPRVILDPLPKTETLKKYGLGRSDLIWIIETQFGVCAICGKIPKKWCVDHYHVKGFKKMPDEQKRRYVRGALCWFCNHYYLGRSITVQKARNVVRYLEDFEKRLQGKAWDQIYLERIQKDGASNGSS